MIIFLLFLVSCSKEGEKIADYFDGARTNSVIIRDLKVFYPEVARSITLRKNVEALKDFLFEKYFLEKFQALEVIKKGYTNEESFKSEVEREMERYRLAILNQYGKEQILKKRMNKEKYEYLKALFIRMEVRNYVVTKDGKVIRMNFSEREKLREKVKKEIFDIFRNIETSPVVMDEFVKYARTKSDSYMGKNRGEEVIILRGSMDENQENLLFSGKAGMVNKVFEEDSGFTLFYITQAPKVVDFKEISALVKKEDLERNILNRFMRGCIKIGYKIEDGRIVLKEGKYAINELPDNLELVRIYDRGYNWGEIRKIITIFKEDYFKNLNIANFEVGIKQFCGFMAAVAFSEMLKYDRSKEFSKKLEEHRENYIRRLLVKKYNEEFGNFVSLNLKDENLKAYYEKNRNRYPEPKNKKNFSDFFKSIKENLKRDYIMEMKKEMDNNLRLKYRIQFYDRGLKEFVKISQERSRKKKSK
jgi:hypothetical protein